MKPSNTILVVEDEAIIGADIQATLEGLGYRVPRVVASGADALAAMDALHPDLVLMDIRIQGDLDGVETAKQVRRERDVPIVFLTSHSDQATLERAKEAGPQAYLLKPFDEKDLRTTIEVTLHTHELERRLARAERLAAVAGLAGAMAHEINNPLASISGNIGYVKEQVRALLGEHCRACSTGPDVDDLLAALDDISNEARRIGKTVKHLRLLSEGERAPYSAVAFSLAVASAAAVADAQLKQRARLEVSIDPGAVVRATDGLLMQLVLHLLLRAAHAADGAVEDNLVTVAVLARADGVILQVCDTGRPMSADELRRMSDPLPVTTNFAQLPGLTLALANRIAVDLDARLVVAPGPSRGTTVEVHFPPAPRA